MLYVTKDNPIMDGCKIRCAHQYIYIDRHSKYYRKDAPFTIDCVLSFLSV